MYDDYSPADFWRGFWRWAGVGLFLSACGPPSANQQEHQQQSQDATNYETNQPLLNAKWSQERQNLIDIEAAEVNDVQTTTFMMNYGVRDPISSCPSIGFGIPDSASLSNPVQLANSGDSQSTALGQMDPNGIYAPMSSSGTFIICLTNTGQPYIDRIESSTDTYGGPAEWDFTKHRAIMTGAPTATARAGRQ